LKRDFTTTFITEALVVAGYLLTFRLVANALGTSGFGEYALARRTLAVLVPLGALSLDVAVARYVAYAVSEGSERARRYAPAGIALVLAAVAVLSAVLLLFSGPLAALFFGSAAYSNLVMPMPLLLLGGSLHGIAYGHLRGRSLILWANLLMALNQAVIPVLAIVLFGSSVESILLAMGIGWIGVSVVFLAFVPMSLGDPWPQVKQLVRFGVPRLPGDLLRLTVFALPSLLVAHVADITSAGGVAFAVAAVGMLGTALAPVGFVMLPVAARLMAQGSIPELRRHVVQIAQVTAIALFIAIVVVELFAPQIVSLYLGPRFAGTADSLRVIVPAALPWGLYMSLGSVIDAHHVNPVNARNMGIAFGVFLPVAGALTLFGAPALWIAAAFVLSLYVLGALTLYEIHSITTIRDPSIPLEPEINPQL
jgi:O-antigen/teichoic acid export membrane protein